MAAAHPIGSAAHKPSNVHFGASPVASAAKPLPTK